MSRRAVALAALLLALAAWGAMRSNTAWKKRRQERAILDDKIAEYVAANQSARFVDIGVELRVVVQDPEGTLLLPGRPRMRVLRVHRAGGMLDTRANPPRIVSGSHRRQVWHCSEDQEPVILHGDDQPLGQVVYGSEGAGKSTAIAMWLYFRWLELISGPHGQVIGCTAPTQKRMKIVRDEVLKLWPPAWRHHRKSDEILVLPDRTLIQFVSTHKQSASDGSPVQGFNWSAAARDELQDQIHAHEDIEARGRSAPNARYKQIGSCTAKDAGAWRDFRDALIASGDWIRRTLLGRRSPFVDAKFWDQKLRSMSPREYARRVLAQDVPPELAVFYAWERERNLVRGTQFALDVTVAILADYQSYVRPGARFALLAGHDPGSIYNTTVLYRLLVMPMGPGAMPLARWHVVGELQTKQTTARQHAVELKKYIQERFGFERAGMSKVAIFCDPHGKGEAQTDYQSVYMAFQKEGLDVFNPTPMIGRIKRAARIEMINRLCFAADTAVRFVVLEGPDGKPVAPILVDALESLEKRPGDDSPEGEHRKDETDKTHAPAAAAYALWPFEQEAFTDRTIAAAVAAARKMAA